MKEATRRSRGFDQAVQRVRLLIEGAKEGPSPKDLSTVIRGLTRFLTARFPMLEASDVSEVVDETLVRFVDAIRQGRLDRARAASAYLTTIARNLVISSLRTQSPVPVGEAFLFDRGQEDDAIASMLDADADALAVRSAMSLAAREGEHTIVRVVACWLDLAEELGRKPSTRQVAALAGVSHTTVQEALKRFLNYLPNRPTEA